MSTEQSTSTAVESITRLVERQARIFGFTVAKQSDRAIERYEADGEPVYYADERRSVHLHIVSPGSMDRTIVKVSPEPDGSCGIAYYVEGDYCGDDGVGAYPENATADEIGAHHGRILHRVGVVTNALLRR